MTTAWLEEPPDDVPLLPLVTYPGAQWVDDIDIPDEEPPMALAPFVLDEGPTVVFGMGETRKSILAQAIATSVGTGREIIPGWRPTVSGPVLWLDYESSRRRLARRQKLLGSAPIMHVPCVRPVWDIADALERLATSEAVQLVVVDSIVPASAGGAVSSKDAETAARYFGAVNRIAPRSLSIGHITKDNEGTMPFGSVFFHNLARLTWRAQADKDGRVTLTNHKHTDGDRLPATTLVFDFGERLTISHTTPQLTPAMVARIVVDLPRPMTSGDIARAVQEAGYPVGKSWLKELVGRAVQERSLVRLSRDRYETSTGLTTGLSPLEVVR